MKILKISTHRELLVLSSAHVQALGFHVAGVDDLPGVQDLFEGGKEFDLVILCHTLDDAQKRSICDFIRARYPAACILELYLTKPLAAQGVAVEATAEFHHLMRMLAWDDTTSEFRRPFRQVHNDVAMTRPALTH
jgi:DNA-binding response OmpR family regulator